MPLKYVTEDVDADPYSIDFEVGDACFNRRPVAAKVDHKARRCTITAPRRLTLSAFRELAGDILNAGIAIGEYRAGHRVPVVESVS